MDEWTSNCALEEDMGIFSQTSGGHSTVAKEQGKAKNEKMGFIIKTSSMLSKPGYFLNLSELFVVGIVLQMWNALRPENTLAC